MTIINEPVKTENLEKTLFDSHKIDNESGDEQIKIVLLADHVDQILVEKFNALLKLFIQLHDVKS